MEPRRIGRNALCALLCALPALADPSPAFLVKDLGTSPVSNFAAGDFTDASGIAYFAGFRPSSGSELWTSDGTAAGTRIVRDLFPGTTGSSPSDKVWIGGTLFFVASHTTGRELWKSDGTAAGTSLVKDINPGPESSSPSSLVNLNGTLYFAARSGLNDVELWRSDGTEAGTVLVKDIVPGTSPSFPSNLTNVNGTLFFAATDPVNGRELWKSDGTDAGTVLVKDITAGSASSSPTSLTNANGTVFFTANLDNDGNSELWKSDGTSAGTVKLSNPLHDLSELTAVNGRVFFSSGIFTSGALWTSDGTIAGTISLKQFYRDDLYGEGNSTPMVPKKVGNTLFFRASAPGSQDYELWKSDGTAAGSVRVKDVVPGSVGSSPSEFEDVNGTLFFIATQPAGNYQLWKSDGTDAGTVLVTDVPYSNGFGLANVNGTLFFSAGTDLQQLWRSDGTGPGTFAITEFSGTTDSGIDVHYSMSDVGGTLFFNRYIFNQPDTWRSDGTSGGTFQIRSAPTTSGLSFISKFQNVNGRAFFSANDGIHGGEPWTSDGTIAGTAMVKDIWPGSFQSLYCCLGFFEVVNGAAFFEASDTTTGFELWKSDGTETGTTRVKDIVPGSGGSEPSSLTNVNGTLFFSAKIAGSGDIYGNKELWKSDGTEAGTVLVKDINPGPNSSLPQNFVNVNGMLYFSAFDAAGFELWKSDGTSAGTVRVADINPGPSGSGPNLLTNANGRLFFFANDGVHGSQVWTSDGTTAGTFLLKDIVPANSTSRLRGGFAAVSNTLFFVPYDAALGFELWKSDGTTAGTVPVKDTWPGIGDGALSGPFAVGNVVVFAGNDGVSGDEPWASDGTEANTHLVADIGEGDGGSLYPNNAEFIVSGPRVFFQAIANETSAELWAVPIAALMDSDLDGLDYAAETANGTDPFDADSDDDGLADGAEVNTYGTNPNDADSDHDGSSDSAEVVAGTSPLDPGRYPVTVPTVPIADPGNAPDVTGFGAVAGKIRTGIVEVTVKQYVSFLNAVADTDTYGLFGALPGIERTGSPGGYVYGALAGQEGRPVTFVSFYDALRFVNWLENGQPDGPQGPATTEDGAYTITSAGIAANSIARNPSAHFALPTEDEWYKTAYYQTSTHTYVAYPIIVPGAIFCTTPQGSKNAANCGDAVGDSVNVASYGAPSPNGTLDQGGNVWEWTESKSGADRRIRGGGFHSPDSELSSANSGLDADPLVEDADLGFRVPEPARTWQLLAGIAALTFLHRRRKSVG
jgi:ELWxxDGT repeat protein